MGPGSHGSPKPAGDLTLHKTVSNCEYKAHAARGGQDGLCEMLPISQGSTQARNGIEKSHADENMSKEGAQVRSYTQSSLNTTVGQPDPEAVDLPGRTQGSPPAHPPSSRGSGRSQEGCPSHLDGDVQACSHGHLLAGPCAGHVVGVTALCHHRVFSGVG